MKKLIVFLILVSPGLLFGQIEPQHQVKAAIELKQYEKGLRIIDSLITEDATNNVIYYYKALCEWRQGNFDSSISSSRRSLNTTVEEDSLYNDILFLRSSIYISARELDSAIKETETLVKAFPDIWAYLINMSYLYGENKQYYNCLKVLKQAMAIDSINVLTLNNLAYYNAEVKDYEAAIKYANKGLGLTEDSVWISSLLNTLGLAQAKTMSSEKGLLTIRRSLRYKPDNAYAYYNLALIYLDKKEMDRCCKNLKKAKELGGDNMTYWLLKQYCN